MQRTIIESPYKGTPSEVARNEAYARKCMLHSLEQGEAPFLSHLLYTQVLEDTLKPQRSMGINAGLAWGEKADKVAVYTDLGITDGMALGVQHYTKLGIPIEYRSIGKDKAEGISIVVFKWNKKKYRTKFTSEHVNRFFKMIDKHVSIPHRKICITDDAQGIDKHIHVVPLWENPCERYAKDHDQKPNCFYRLKMFSSQMKNLIGERFVWMDLDAIIMDNIDDLLLDQADLKMWRVDGEYMPCNGSMVLHRLGTREEIWTRFNPDAVHPVTGLRKAGMIGSDQAWIGTMLTDIEKENTFGQKDGIYSYRCHIKKILDRGDPMPKNCRIVFFHGKENPWDSKLFHSHQWIQDAYS